MGAAAAAAAAAAGKMTFGHVQLSCNRFYTVLVSAEIPRLEMKTHSSWTSMYFPSLYFTTVLNTTLEKTFSEITEDESEEGKAGSKACWDDSHMAIPD